MKHNLVCMLLVIVAFHARAADRDWDKNEFGIYIHYGLSTFAPKDGKPEDFKVRRIDTKNWAKAARVFGAGYICLTVKHEQGFCLWDSVGYEQDIGSSPAENVDLIGETIKACKGEGILFGVHYSVPDRFNEGRIKFNGAVPPKYFETIMQHALELLDRYPEIAYIKFDGAKRLSDQQRFELYDLIKTVRPECVVNLGTWKWNNPMRMGVSSVPSGLPTGVYCPTEACISVVKGWGWKEGYVLVPEDTLYKGYVMARESGASFLVNLAPDQDGDIASDQLRALSELEREIQRNPVPLTKVNKAAPSSPKTGSGGGEYEQKLKKLKSLYEQGMISKEVYEKKQEELLDAALQ